MLKYRYAIFVVFAVMSISCAKRGTITGGPKDTIAPVLEMSIPKNMSTDFKGSQIKLYFDEYVKLKDVNKQLVVSPPMNTAPEITPSSASKIVTIKIKDTLKPNTTYSFNFGQSIQDNNESNPYPQFKYVFSTGTYIDSLSVEGSIEDALEKKTDNFVTVGLYEINETYNDSTIYKDKPRYVTNTLDSLKTFKLENLKAGKYQLVALKDINKNYKFNAAEDKIGFYSTPITIPTTEKYTLKLFSEKSGITAQKPVQASSNRAILPFRGDSKDIRIEVRNGTEILPTVVTQFPEKDSLQVWYKPIKADSLSMKVTKGSYVKDFVYKIRSSKKDSINISAVQNGTLNFRDVFTLKTATPLVKFDESKISIRNKDSVAVPFKTEYDEMNQRLKISFGKSELQKYKVLILPGALTDLMEQSNDTLSYRLSTKAFADYGNLKLNLKNVKQFPVIVQLTDDKGKILAEEYSESSPTVDFEALEPNKFTVRVIYDTNANKVWDSGSFLDKRQPEEVIYFPTPIDVRSNWDVDQDFDLSVK